MIAKIKTVSFMGLDAVEVKVEVHIGNGLPFFTIVGLPDKNISEAKERIRAVFNVIGVSLPAKRITVNMSPANLPKEGSHYDLPIALGILTAMGSISQDFINNWLVIGELSLDGELNVVKGALLAAIYSNAKNYTLVCPAASGKEVKLSGNENVLIFKNILEIIAYQNGGGSYLLDDYEVRKEDQKFNIDMQDVEGQYTAKRVLEIAAVFRLNILMIGSPGVGKSMLAKRIQTISPQLTAKESLEVSMIYSIAENVKVQNFFEAPYRDPHYSITLSALIGGGTKALPGEVTLAHKGILFLDELGEYSKVLEGLRQVMEDKKVTIARANNHISYPADCQVVAAMNPCKCGYFNTSKQCKKVPMCQEYYMSKISGPLLERFDFIIYLDNEERYIEDPIRETSAKIKERVIKAKELYNSKYDKDFNDLLLEDIQIDDLANDLLEEYCKKKVVSKRVKIKLIKISFVIALLDEHLFVKKQHIAEAMMYRKV